MTRRDLLLTAAALGTNAWAQSRYPGVAYREYSRCQGDFLAELARTAYQRRNRELAKLTDARAIGVRQRWVRETFWKLMGGMPERTPLNARAVGGFERPGYRLEKLVYESTPGFFIPANLYIPSEAKPPFPGILFQMGHSPNGKAGETYQKCCQGLARLGYLVLAFDPMGQGERAYYASPGGTLTRLPSADDEHTLPGRQMLLVGDSATRLQTWDAVRSLDYLASHPLVDQKRLGSTGQSGGGTVTMLLAAVDDRLSAAVVASGNTENMACANFNPPGSTDDAEQNLVGSGPLGFDRWDLLYPLAPKPLLVMVSARDFFGTYSPRYIAAGWEEYQKLRRVYSTLGHADRLKWADTPLPHGLSYDQRLRVYNWFERWLKNSAKAVTEEPLVSPEPDQAIWAGPTGNTVRDFHSQTPWSLVRQRAADIRAAGKPADIERLLGIERPAENLRANLLGRVPSSAADIEAIEVASAPKVWLPAWLFLPKKPNPARSTLLLLNAHGRNTQWHEGEMDQTLAAEGSVVCAADLRGAGDLTPEVGRGSAAYTRPHDSEDDFAWASLILGRPMIGQRVTDILALVRALRRHAVAGQRRLVVAATGAMTAPALIAAALTGEIDSLYLEGALVSFRNIIECEEYNHTPADIIPGILAVTDLPEIAASMAPRRVLFAGPVDAAGKPLSEAAFRKAYGQAKNAERAPEVKWTLDRLREL